MTKAQEPRTSHMCVMFATGRGSIITLLRQTSKNFSPPPSLLASRVRVRRSLAALLTSLRGVGHLLGSGGGRNRNEPCTGPRARTRWEGLTMQAGSVSDPPYVRRKSLRRIAYDVRSICLCVCPPARPWYGTTARLQWPRWHRGSPRSPARLAMHTTHLCLSGREEKHLPQCRF